MAVIEPSGDRNFDDLAHRFKRNVYDHLKGDIRLAVLNRDLAACIPLLYETPETSADWRPLSLLDAGGGQGQLAVAMAGRGHQVALCDISANMLEIARQNAATAAAGGAPLAITFIHDSIQNHAAAREGCFDVVLCHAVLEWVADPATLLALLCRSLKPGGYLSLTFYNVDSIKMKNLLRTNFGKVLADDYQGYRGSLTPTWPRHIDEVRGWIAPLPLSEVCHSGIRCFHDYILDPGHRVAHPDRQMTLELRLSREEPFRSLGRYIHLLYRRHK